MRIPTAWLNDTVAVSRRVQTGAGVSDDPVGTYRARVQSSVKVTPTADGPIMMRITTIYVRAEADVETGDRITLPTGDEVEARDVTRFAPQAGGTAYRKVVSW